MNLFSIPAMPLMRPLPCAEMLIIGAFGWVGVLLKEREKKETRQRSSLEKERGQTEEVNIVNNRTTKYLEMKQKRRAHEKEKDGNSPRGKWRLSLLFPKRLAVTQLASTSGNREAVGESYFELPREKVAPTMYFYIRK